MDSDALLEFKRRTYQALCDRALDLDVEGDRKLYSGPVLSYDNDTSGYDVHQLVKNDVMLTR